MSKEERETMIRTMVSGLSERLTNEGGPVDEWTRLIRAYGVLGEIELASQAWQEAQLSFAEDETALKLLLNAARDARVTRK